jgi:hypothetical protein
MYCTKSVLGRFVFVGSVIAADPAVGTWKLNVANRSSVRDLRRRVTRPRTRKAETG